MSDGALERLSRKLAVIPWERPSAGHIRRAWDTWNPKWFTENWPMSGYFLAIGTALTGRDLSWRRSGSYGWLGVNPQSFGGEDTYATDPVGLWVDPDILSLLPGRKLPYTDENGADALKDDWIGAFLNQMRWTENPIGLQWRHPAPTTVWEENIQKGRGVVSLETVPFRGTDTSIRQDLLFIDPVSGKELSNPVQEILWVMASRGALLSLAWWNPADARKIALLATQAHSYNGAIELTACIRAATALGMTRAVQLLGQYHSAIVWEMAQNPLPFLRAELVESERYASEVVAAWLSGSRSASVVDGMVSDTKAGVEGLVEGAGSMLWIALGVGVAALLIWAYSRGKQ